MGYLADYEMGLLQPEQKDNFLHRKLLPLGTVKPYHFYKTQGFIPDEDIVYLPLDKKEVRAISFLALPGVGKTKGIKRILDYYHKAGYKILVIEPKESEYLSMEKEGTFKRIHPDETPRGIPVQQFAPLFIEKTPMSYYTKKFTKYAIALETMREPSDWATIGIVGRGAQWLTDYAKKGNDLKHILSDLYKAREKKNIHGTTRMSIENQIQFLNNDMVFDAKYPDIDLKKWWDEDKVVVISFFMTDERYSRLHTGKILQKALWLGQRTNFKILVIIDDSHLITPTEGEVQYNIAKKMIRNYLSIGRKMNVNLILATQSVELIDSVAVEMSKTMIIGRIGNPEELSKKFGNPRILQAIRQLHYDPDKLLSQFVLTYEDGMRFKTFYFFDPLCGHTF